MFLKLEDLGRLQEGTLIQEDGEWFIRTDDGKLHSLSEMLTSFKDKQVRVTVADLGLLKQAEQQLQSLAHNVTGLSNKELAARLKKNQN